MNDLISITGYAKKRKINVHFLSGLLKEFDIAPDARAGIAKLYSEQRVDKILNAVKKAIVTTL